MVYNSKNLHVHTRYYEIFITNTLGIYMQLNYVFLLMFQLITAKLIQVGSNMPSSPDSSSDSSAGSPHHTFDGPNIEAESCLPGVVRRYIIPCRTK